MSDVNARHGSGPTGEREVPSDTRASPSPSNDIIFRAADIAVDRAVLVTFARDLFATSFADASYFDRRFGPDGDAYAEWLLDRTGGVPAFASLAMAASEPVGMVVVGPEPGEPDVGHLFHLYLCPAARARGFGPPLERHAVAVLAAAGFNAVRLNVGVGNTSAIAFYLRLGWCDTGAGDQAGVRVMDKRLSG